MINYNCNIMVSGQLPLRKIAPRLGVGFGSKLGLVLGLGATRQLPRGKLPPRLGLGVELGLVLSLQANFPWGQLSLNHSILIIILILQNMVSPLLFY